MEKKNFTNTSGMHSSLFSSKESFKNILTKTEAQVWVCEGEWDGIAFHECISQLEENISFISVPSAGVFKGDWIQLFNNKDVVLAYDNDDAGRAGAKKVFDIISSSVKSIKCLHWLPSEEFSPKTKCDVRDCYNALGAEKAFKYFNENLRNEPSGFSSKTDSNIGIETEEEKIIYDRIEASAVREAYAGWLHLPDLDVIDVLFGSILANRLSGDPLWMFLIAPAGGTKTEFCMSLADAPTVECLSSLTPHTLVSGANFGGGDPSLLPRLRNRILVIKDFTTILNLHPTDREAIFGILRDAYDGEFTKSFGNGITRHYKSKFGIIAGVTPAIEHYVEDNVALGERFLRYKLLIADSISGRQEFLKRALKNSSHEKEMRLELRAIAKSVLSYKYESHTLPEASESTEEQIISIAQILSMFRGVVSRNRYTNEVQHKPFHELGTRLTKQFIKLACGISLFRNERRITKEVLTIVRKVAESTIPTLLCDTISAMQIEKSYQADEVSHLIHMPIMVTQRLLENLTMLHICEREKKSLLKTSFKIKNDFAELLIHSKIFNKEA